MRMGLGTRSGIAMVALLIALLPIGCREVGGPSPVQTAQPTEPAVCYLHPRHALSPDGTMLLLNQPTRVVDVLTGESVRLRSIDQLGGMSWSWSPASDSIVYSVVDAARVWLKRCSIPQGQVKALDTRAVVSLAPDTILSGACYIDDDRLLVVLGAGSFDRPVDPQLVVVEVKGNTLDPVKGPVSIPNQAAGGVLWAPYLGAQRDYCVIYIAAGPSGQNGTYAVRLSDLKVVPLLCEDRVREITGAMGVDLSMLGRVGDYNPAVASGSAYACLRDHGGAYVSTLVAIDLATDELRLSIEAPDLLAPVSPEPRGERIACAMLEEATIDEVMGNLGRSSIWVFDRSMKNGKRLTSGKHWDVRPVWNDALGEIIFQRDRKEIRAVHIDSGEQRRICIRTGQTSQLRLPH